MHCVDYGVLHYVYPDAMENHEPATASMGNFTV